MEVIETPELSVLEELSNTFGKIVFLFTQLLLLKPNQ